MILVTGATGNVGREVVSQLLAEGVAVRALTRDPSAAELPGGVEVVRGDLADPGNLDEALTGIESVFLVWPSLSADHAASEAVRTIAKYASRVVYLSARGVPDDPEEDAGAILGSHAFLERLIRTSGVEWTFLRAGGFASNTLGWAAQIRTDDVVRWPYGEAGRSLIHERDIAAVGVRALLDEGHTGARHVLTGPQTLTQREHVRIIGEVIGRPLRFDELTPEVAREELFGGAPPEFADAILAAHAKMVAAPETVTSTVQEITGRPAHTYREWVADHIDAFRRPHG